MTEDPFEITHIPGHLRATFTGILAEAQSGKPDEREVNFLSRALAAFAVHKLTGSTLRDAADSVVDGGGDWGIDAVYYAETTNILWVAQSKFHRNGRGEPDLGSVLKFKQGLEDLLSGNFEVFESNDGWRRITPKLRLVFENSSLQVRALLVYSGINLISEDRERIFEALESRFSAGTDYLQIRSYNLTTIHDWITGANNDLGVSEAQLYLMQTGWIREPYETIYGMVSLDEIAALYKQYPEQLISANIRKYKGNTKVNERIVMTIREQPEHFFYFNNGLTAYCQRFEIPPLERQRYDKRIRVFGFSIVNGAQTLGSILHCVNTDHGQPLNGYAFLKIISLERCENDRDFARQITHSTNFQNQIGPRDFIALTEQQERIAAHLAASGIGYFYKDDVDMPDPDESNFTLDEATTACATLADKPDCDLCARILANPKSLWSLEEIYPETDLYRSRYARIFKQELSARTVWRAVQTQRVVRSALRNSERGVRKDFFDNCRWLILNLIFLRLRPHQGTVLELTEEEKTKISTATVDYAEKLWTVCQNKGLVTVGAVGSWDATRHFRSVFSSASDCKLLRDALLANLPPY